MQNNILNKKNCLITGATGSLGVCLAKSFSKYGCNLFLTSRTREKLENLKKQLGSINQDIKISYETGNLENIEDIYKVIKKAKKEMNSIDILINNAGVVQFDSLIDSTIEDFDYMFSINVRATLIFCKELCKDMIKKRWGRIINIGSVGSYNGWADTAIYCASKHAILGFSRSLYEELKNYNVRVFCVSPGTLVSEMGKLVTEKFKLRQDTFIEPDEMAEYIAFSISFNKEMISKEIRLDRIQESIEH